MLCSERSANAASPSARSQSAVWAVSPPSSAGNAISHNAVAAAVAQGRADWGIAIESVAGLYGLAFLPIAPEDYDFLLVERRHERPAVQAFLEVLREEAVRERIRALGMHPAEQ